MNLPLKYSIQLWIVSGGSVSFMCFRASSRSTSPVGVSDFKIIFLQGEIKLSFFWFYLCRLRGCTQMMSCSRLRNTGLSQAWKIVKLYGQIQWQGGRRGQETQKLPRHQLWTAPKENYLEHKPRRRIPAFSSSMRPRSPSSIRMHPRSPLDMQSFQNDV